MMIIRPRRLRSNQHLRSMVRETRLAKESLILPFFVREGNNVAEEISSLPGQIRYSPDTVARGIDAALKEGVQSFMLFGIPDHKDETGTEAYSELGVVQQALRNLKKVFGNDIYLVTDVCLCEYTSHGHCGLLTRDGAVDNDHTLPLLAKTALSHVQAGADMIAPSDMMDGRIAAIRAALDKDGFINTPIMSYAAKYASAYYGPFREAAGSAPQFGDRKAYQMDYHNSNEAIKEVLLDVAEGADIVMVKPALAYLDIIAKVKAQVNLPVAAYSVSGEYAMIKAAAAQDLVDEYKIMCESAVSIYRAGADILITYYAKELAKAIKEGDIG